MHPITFPLTMLPLLFASGMACAVEVYRCSGTDGAVVFQDRPCPATTRQQRIALPDDRNVPPPQPPPDESARSEEPSPDSADTTARATPPPRVPAPDFYLCLSWDGNRYLSDTGIGRSNWVPYAALGESRSLAEAYGGRNGIGVSAPGLRTPATVHSPIGGAYVQVEDTCHHAAPAEACAYLRTQLDEIEGKLRRAFSDTEAQLRQQQKDLQNRARGC